MRVDAIASANARAVLGMQWYEVPNAAVRAHALRMIRQARSELEGLGTGAAGVRARIDRWHAANRLQ